jgi:hypothetical protein
MWLLAPMGFERLDETWSRVVFNGRKANVVEGFSFLLVVVV